MLRDAEVFEDLPQGVWRPRRYGAAFVRWYPVDGGVEIDVRFAPVQVFRKLRPQRSEVIVIRNPRSER